MLKIGITGGIGTGKTTACKIFEELGIPAYYADDRARWIQHHVPELVNAIKKLFGENIYKDGILDRALLGTIVFSDKEKLNALNDIVHPAVFKDAEHWQEEQRIAKKPYTLKEAALLYETGSYKQLDKIIVVCAPLELRIERIKKRDNISAEEIIKRIESQMPQEEKEKKADFVLINIDLESLERQVYQLHQTILSLIK